ncbi:MAG: hypothetical protein PVF45_14795 [Anaerolineae bacterium]
MILSLVLALSTFAGEARADSPCLPPSCHDDGGDGSGSDPPGDGTPGSGSLPPGVPPPAPPIPGGEDPGDEDPGAGTYMSYTCSFLALCPEKADYTIYFLPPDSWATLVSFSCRTHESCEGDTDSEEDEWPCTPTFGDGGVELECEGEWDYYIYAWAGIPPHRVKRHPFPRGLVTLPNEFDLLAEPWISESGGPNFGGDGFYSDKVNIPDPVRDDPQPGDIKDYEIGVRWRRVGDQHPQFGYVPLHCFDFDERDWNVEWGAAPAACGQPEADGHIRVSHAYETSSWDKPGDDNGPSWDNPANGPRVDLENQVVPSWDLVAYQVRVPTYWVVEWRDRWYSWDLVGVEWGNCGCWGPPGEPTNEPYRRGCTPPPGICNQPGEWYGRVGDPLYDWVEHDSEWYALDLRSYGYYDWFETSYSVISGGEFGGQEWWSDVMDAVPVPVIEVQSVLEP